MSTQMGLTAGSTVEGLSNAPFIPVKFDKETRMFRPMEVYFSSRDSHDNLYRSAFTFVDFGDRANSFLRYCGVRSEPSVKGMLSQAGVRLIGLIGIRHCKASHARTREDALSSWITREVSFFDFSNLLKKIDILNSCVYLPPIGRTSTTRLAWL